MTTEGQTPQTPGTGQYEAIVESVSDAAYFIDSDRNIAYTNQPSLQHPTVSLEAVCDGPIMDLIERIVSDDEDPTRFERALETVYDQSADADFPVTIELDIDGPTGTATREYRCSPCETQSGTGAIVVSGGGTERSESELERYERLFETLPVAVGVISIEESGRFEFVNQTAVEMFDADSKRELEGYSLDDLYADPDEQGQLTDTLRAKRTVEQYETEFTTLDGERLWVSITAELTEIEGKQHIVGTVEEISERQQREREIQEAKTVTDGILDSLHDVFYAFDTEANLVEYNERLRSVTGYDHEELERMAPWEFFPEGERELIMEAVGDIIETGEPVRSLKAHYLTKSGATIPYEFSGSPYYDSEGTVAGFVGFGRDITDRKEREQELERKQEFLSQTQEVAAVGGWEVDLRTDSLRWTDEVYRIHGVDSDFEPTVRRAIDLYHPEDRAAIREAVERATAEGEPYDMEVRIVRPDGEVRWTRARGEPWHEDGKIVGVRGTFQDISDRKEREQELARHQKVIQAVDDGVYALDETGHFELVNDAMSELTGYSTEQLLGEHTSYIKPDRAVERAESLVQSMVFDDHSDNEATFELEIQRTDGSEFPAEDHMTLLWDDDGERFEGTAGIIRNITDRKAREQELRTVSEQLEVLNRILRHDIRNDTQMIQLSTEELRSKLPEEHQDSLQRIQQTNEHIQELTENSRALIQALTQGELETEPVRLDTVVRDELESARLRYPDADITVEGSLDRTLVSANGTLSSVVRNLLNNAVQHNRGEVRVTVRVEQRDDFLRLCVLDNGIGVPDDQKEEIFGKGEQGMEGVGTGIGLYLVNELVRSYGGDVWVMDRENGRSDGSQEHTGGAVFVVKLPTATG